MTKMETENQTESDAMDLDRGFHDDTGRLSKAPQIVAEESETNPIEYGL